MNTTILSRFMKIVRAVVLTVIVFSALGVGKAVAANSLQFGSINGGTSPQAGVAFSVTVFATDGITPIPVSAPTVVTLSRASGTGTLGGNLTGVIQMGTDSVVISGVTYTKAESNVSLTATETSGDPLSSATSSVFTVVPGPASKTTSTIAANPTSVTADGTASTITVQLKDANNNNLTSSGGAWAVITNFGSSSGTTDNGNGTYTATVSSFVTGSATVRAYLNLDTLSNTATVTFTPGAASKFAVTMSGGTTLLSAAPKTAGTPFLVRVTAQDTYGNTATSYHGTVNLGSNAYVGSVPATILNNGTGLVDNISITPTVAGTNDAITTSDGVINVGGSGVFTVNPGPPSTSTSTVSANPTSIVANGASTSLITVQLKDAYGNNLTTGGSSVGVTAPLGSLGSVSDLGNGSYNATLTSGTVAGTDSVTATISSTPITNKAGVVFTPGPLAKFAVTMSGGTTPLSATAKTAGVSFQVRVTAQDANGNTVTSFTGPVTLTSTAFGGNVIATIAANGLVDNVGIVPTNAGSSKTISASGGSITTSPASSTFTVNPGAAKKVVVTQEPSSSAVAGQAFVTQPWVAIEDSLGNIITTDNSTTVTATAIGGTGTLSGNLSANASGGVAKFTNLSYLKSETIRIRFTAGGLLADTSVAIVVSAGGASKVVITRQPSTNAVAGQNFSTQPQASIEDALGNVITADNASQIGVQVLGGTGGTLNGTTTLTVASGVATFTNLNYTKMESIRLRFASGSLVTDTSVTIAVNHAAADSMAIVSGNGQTAPISTALSPMVVHISDSYGNAVDSVNVAFNVTGFPVGATGSFSLNPASAVSATSGNASSVLTLGNKVGLYTAQASAALKGSPITFTATATPGAAGRLVILQQPNPTQIAGRVFAPNPTVSVQDTSGNIVTSDNSSLITATLSTGTGLLQGTTQMTAANGQVAFSNLSYNIAEPIVIQFTSPGLSKAVTSTITVSPDTAYALAIKQQAPSTIAAGTVISPALKVQLVDRSGNAVAKSGTNVTLAVASGNPELQGTKIQATDANGLATFPDILFNSTGGRRLQFTSSPLQRAVSDTLTVGPATPDTLVFVANPSNAKAGATFATPPIVEVRDRFGNVVTGYALNVTVALTTPGGAILSGTTTVPDSLPTGHATFYNLSVNKTGTYTLKATSPSVSKSGQSASFTISPGSAVHVAFSQQPTTVNAGSRILPAVAVAVQDTFGNVVTTSSDSIGVTLLGGGTLVGGSKKQASSGIATFDSLIISTSGTGKRLLASAKSLRSDTSTTFDVKPATPSKLVFTTQPGNGIAGITLGQLPVITMEDQYGNTVTGVKQKVALFIKDTATAGGFLLDSTHTVKVDSLTANVDTLTGRAAFTNLSINKAGHRYTLTATGSTVQPTRGVAVSDTFAIAAGTAQKVRIETQFDGTGTLLVDQKVSSGTSITVFSVSRDNYDNYVANVAADVGGWTITVFTGGIVASDLVPSADRRSAVFSGHVIGTARINVAVAGLTSVPSDTLTVVQAGSPTKVVVETAGNGTGQVVPRQSLISGHSVTMYAIARDASDNFVANIAADWLLVKLAGGIADTDLIASTDKRSAVFTGHRVGRAQVLASSGSLSGVRSDTLTVVNGSAAALLPVSGTTPLSTLVGTMFATPLAAEVVDSSGNPVPAAVVRFSAPLSGPSSIFGSRQDTSVMANASGVATAPPMQANMISGTYFDTASVHGATPALFALTNSSAPIYNFTITSTNGGRIGTQYTQVPFPVRIAARDSFGNVATGFTGAAVVGSSGVLLSGSGTTPNFVAGVLDSYPVSFDSAGSYFLTVRRSGGTESGVSDSIDVQNPPPTFTSLTPVNGLAGGTLQITIRGTGFIAGVTVVLFSDAHIHALTPIVDSFTQLRVTVQVDSSVTTGPKNVTIANIQPGGGTVIVQSGFIVGNNPTPTLTSIAPASGVRGRSMTVGLSGSNFVPGATSVDFGQGITVNTLAVDSATHITSGITISTTAQLGDRQITVVNAPPGGGTSQTITFTVNADPSSPPSLAAPPSGYSAQSAQVTLQWTAPLSDSVASYQLQVSADTNYATRYADTTITGTSIQLSSLTGYATYFWHVRAKRTSGITSSYSASWSFNTYPTQISVSNTVSFPQHDSPGQYSTNDYRLLGVPGSDNSQITKYLTGTAGQDWIAYYDNGADSSYLVAYSAGDTNFTFARGRAFWILRRGSWAVSGQVTGMIPDSAGRLRIPLHKGWNIITNPLDLSIPWSKVQAANGGIQDSIWSFDGTIMGVQQTFRPYLGYYFENKSNLKSLSIPGGLSLSKTTVPTAPSDTSWTVSMSLAQGGVLVDRSTWFGVAPDAGPDNNRHDFHKPRSIGALSQLVFNRPSWDPRAPRFASDIRPPTSGVQSWDVTALIPDGVSRKSPFTIRFSGIDAVPSTSDVYLVDRKRETYQDLRANAGYTFTAITASSDFSILIGASADVKKELDAIGPKAYSLDQNYPNPFNPTTTISLTVPVKASVSVTIYDILGARVRVLQSGPIAPGRHFFQWDGTNEAGRMTGTGVYFCRMNVTGGPSFTRKMLLIK
ncbi:MAG TPA: invasin domain 3-containing protein [Bacteroidota bacterium]|nr:invasin domain 3-containing protein [Bacteroidota bacterium]